MRAKQCISIIAFAIACSASNVLAGVDVYVVKLNTAADDGFDYDSSRLSTLETPFVASHESNVADLHVLADYMLEHSGAMGTFNISTQHEASGLTRSSFRTVTTGVVGFNTDIPVEINAIGTFDYDLDGHDNGAWIAFEIGYFDWDIGEGITYYVTGDSFYNENTPVSGSLGLDATVTLPARRSWYFSYSFVMDKNYPYTETVPPLSGSGTMQVSYTAIPEPATAVLALGLLAMFRRSPTERRIRTDRRPGMGNTMVE